MDITLLFIDSIMVKFYYTGHFFLLSYINAKNLQNIFNGHLVVRYLKVYNILLYIYN